MCKHYRATWAEERLVRGCVDSEIEYVRREKGKIKDPQMEKEIINPVRR